MQVNLNSLAGLLRSAVPALLLVASLGAAAQPAPQAPLRLIVPFTPGTGIDLIARTVGPKLAERLGRPVVVDNRAGASGNIGTEAVVRRTQRPDAAGQREHAGHEPQPVPQAAV